MIKIGFWVSCCAFFRFWLEDLVGFELGFRFCVEKLPGDTPRLWRSEIWSQKVKTRKTNIPFGSPLKIMTTSYVWDLSVHPTRLIIHSTSFSNKNPGGALWLYETSWRLFGRHCGGVLGRFQRELIEKKKHANKNKHTKHNNTSQKIKTQKQ